MRIGLRPWITEDTSLVHTMWSYKNDIAFVVWKQPYTIQGSILASHLISDKLNTMNRGCKPQVGLYGSQLNGDDIKAHTIPSAWDPRRHLVTGLGTLYFLIYM